MKYGGKPKDLGIFNTECQEMMFYQYLPIKLSGVLNPRMEDRLDCFKPIVGAACCDFIADFGLDRYLNGYAYLTAKHLYQAQGQSFNRRGYHSDGFMTEDINYLWSNELPTVFNFGDFNLSSDDERSLTQMNFQANRKNEFSYPKNSLLRLDQYVIHKVSEEEFSGMRTFVKVSFSDDKYDLKGNSINRLFDYDWDYRDREEKRNIPQKIQTN